MTFGRDLTLALELADVADAMTMARFRAADLQVDTKPDLTPVTEVDRSVELEMRRRLAVARPGQAVLGEEGEADLGCRSGAAQRWIVDPIDGTKNYVRGVPVWASLIALERDGRMVVGVVSAPALGRRWWAARGEGAWAGDIGTATSGSEGRSIRVSTIGRVDDAFISYDGLERFDPDAATDDVPDGRLVRLAHRCWRSRGFGDFWSHVLVAEGAVDIAAEPEVSVWDVAPIQVIVEEAGGRFTDLDGVARADGGSALSTNGILHDEVLASLRRA